jgi:hypothetical protein
MSYNASVRKILCLKCGQKSCPNVLCSGEYSSTTPLYVHELFRRLPVAPVSQIFTVPSADADTKGTESAMEEGNSLKSQIASVCPIYVVTFNDESRSM